MGQLRIGPKHKIQKILKSSKDNNELSLLKDVINDLQIQLEKKEIEYIEVPKEVIKIEEKIVEVIKEVEKPIERIVEVIKEIKVIEEKVIEKPIEIIKEVSTEVEKVVHKIPKWVWMVMSTQTITIAILIAFKL
jgi:hypothetical protein